MTISGYQDTYAKRKIGMSWKENASTSRRPLVETLIHVVPAVGGYDEKTSLSITENQ